MPKYVKTDELVSRYRLLGTGYDAGTLIDLAEGELESRLSGAYAVPFPTNPAPAVVKDLVMDMAYCKSLLARDFKQWGEMSKQLDARIERLVEGLDVIVGAEAQAGELAREGVWSNTMDYQPTHSMLDAEDGKTRVDPTLVDDERAVRD